MSWTQTYSGGKFDLDNPDPAVINIEDIARALSMQCRFNGHVLFHYSVAQHSVLVCDWIFAEQGMLSLDDMLWGLLHDAPEAYLGDVVKPFKMKLEEYYAYERKVEKIIAKKFGLPLDIPDIVKKADKVMVLTEKRDLFIHDIPWMDDDPDVVLKPEKIEPWTPYLAEQAFLSIYSSLEILRNK